MDISEDRRNWLTISRLIHSIQKPDSIYVDEIVKAFHEKLCKDFLPIGKCASPDYCNEETNEQNLCSSCKLWYRKLRDSHKKGENPSWHKNCKSAQWSEDYWEVAKYFMPALGSALSTVKDAQSTDLSSLLNVLEWTKNSAFLGKTRVKVDLVRKLRFQVRNAWAYAPQQELSDDETIEGFSIAIDFLNDLETVCPRLENTKCLEQLECLMTNRITSVVECEKQSLLLQRHLLEGVDTRQIRDDLPKMNQGQLELKVTSCLPDKLTMFTGRKAEIRKVVALLKDENKAVISLHGGPGFGKTAIAIEVSYRLSEDYKIPVLFFQLTNATNEDEMIRQLCLDVGVNHEDEPKPSLILWLKNIKKKVILVMDDIDNLLEDKTSFYEFVLQMRKNSKQQCQIVTTSRMFCEFPDLRSDKILVEEMDADACMELLEKQCSEKDGKFLRKLAEFSGHVPLAVCIAGSLVDDFEDSDELLEYLQRQPMKTLKRPNSNQYVNRAIELSYEKLSGEEQETFVRLSVFEGSFSKSAAETVIEKDNLNTTHVLKKFASRSLIKQETKHRYSIHLLIKHFLKDKQEGREERAEQVRAMRAELLMVKYYLELGHQLTTKSYSKDGYKDNREALKREASNIQNVFKILCQQKDLTSSSISHRLARSKIYTTSARLFSLFVRTVIPESNVDEFLQQCANMAERRKETAIKINFDCLLAEQERSKSIGKTDEHFIPKMEEIKKEFEKHYEGLREDKSLCAHFYIQNGEYILRQAQNQSHENKLDLQVQARGEFQKSLELRQKLAETSVGKADKIFSLLCLGKACKYISASERVLNKENKGAIETSREQAQKYYEEAVKLSQVNLGEHELTSSCYKNLGDLLLSKPKIAEEKYAIAKKMRENLDLDASERHVLLLNNLGKCLRETDRANEAIEVLECARDTAEKLVESDEPTVCQTKVYTSLAIAYDLVHMESEAVLYAKKAWKFDRIEKIIKKYEYEHLQEILQN